MIKQSHIHAYIHTCKYTYCRVSILLNGGKTGDLPSMVRSWRGTQFGKKQLKVSVDLALAGLAQRLEHQPAVPRDPDLVPTKGAYLGCSLSPALVRSCGWQPLDVSLSCRCFSLSLSLSLPLSPSHST
uniref:Uncharacterized protein n=1 Tax=Molossus molossus TaxID=27622 RepID=A0A7J8BKC5_MOLMO|nr:hypothetical protein HJG59_010175 [Molossus molossus]